MNIVSFPPCIHDPYLDWYVPYQHPRHTHTHTHIMCTHSFTHSLTNTHKHTHTHTKAHVHTHIYTNSRGDYISIFSMIRLCAFSILMMYISILMMYISIMTQHHYDIDMFNMKYIHDPYLDWCVSHRYLFYDSIMRIFYFDDVYFDYDTASLRHRYVQYDIYESYTVWSCVFCIC